MTDKNAAWAAAYGAAFDRLLSEQFRLNGWPRVEVLDSIREDARTIADAAVADFEERAYEITYTSYPVIVTHHKPEPAQSTKRDESRDVWVWGDDPRYKACEPVGRLLPEGIESLGAERFVPHSQLVATQRDSELLDAILEAYKATGLSDLDDLIACAVTERSKR